jgi:hypothetical protein
MLKPAVELSHTAAKYFDILENAWAQANESVADSIDRNYLIAGLLIRFQFAGSALVPVIAPAFEHLRVTSPGSSPSFTIRLWDCASTGVLMPPPPCRLEGFTVRGEVRDFHDGQRHAAYQPSERILSVLDLNARVGVVCVASAREIAIPERAAPLRGLLSWLMRSNDRQLVHAAGVAAGESGVLIVGRGGAGKSNTAVGCLLAGLKYAADDFCAVSAAPVPTAHSLYSTAKLHRDGWAQIPYPPSNPDDPDADKRCYYLHAKFAERLPANFRILAIVAPRRTANGCPTLEPISPRIPVLETASETSLMLPDAGAEVLSTLSHIARQVPCYRLDLGSHPHAIPSIISSLIDTLQFTTNF